METKREIISKRRYFYAFVIGTVIFLIGFGITYSVAYFEYQRISNLQDPLSYEIFKNKLEYSLFEKDICSEDVETQISQDLAFQGSIISKLEEKLGKQDESVLFRKKFYSLVLLEHLEYIREYNEKCKGKYNTILFFYSNEKGEIEKSEELGKILSVLAERNEDNLFIYSFDYNLDSELIGLLKQKYNVFSAPYIVLNEETVFTSINNIDEIEDLLD